MHRRTYLTTFGTMGLVSVAGCSAGNDDSGNGGNGESFSSQNNDDNCRIETRTQTETVFDEWETVSAGQTWTVRAEVLNVGDEIEIQAIQTGDGARPQLRIEDPNGDLVLETDVAERIERRITAQQEGRYYLRFENTAVLTSGEWDIDVTYHAEVEEEVC